MVLICAFFISVFLLKESGKVRTGSVNTSLGLVMFFFPVCPVLSLSVTYLSSNISKSDLPKAPGHIIE